MYELTFWGGFSSRYKRSHKTIEAAKAEALKILNHMPNRWAKPAIIYGPNNIEYSVT